jgi:hypothetical protein
VVDPGDGSAVGHNYKLSNPGRMLIFTLLFLFKNNFTLSATIGTELAAQSYVSINQPNNIGSNCFLDNGFTMTGLSVTCTYDSAYPVRGLININPTSKLYLNRDMNCDSYTYFGYGGQIIGDGYTVNLPTNPQTINLPDPNAIRYLNGGVSTQSTSGSANAVSFSYNDQYIAAGLAAGASNLNIYGFSNGVLSASLRTISVGANNVITASWNPTNYYLAVGTNAGTNGLYIYQWSPSAQTLTQTSNPSITGVINCVAWTANGQNLAVSYATGASSAVQVYSCSAAGVLTAVGSPYVYGASGDTTPNALSWNTYGNLIALCKNNGVGATLYILVLNGSSLGLGYSIGASPSNLGAVAFRPINSNSFNVAVDFFSVAVSDSNSDAKNILFSYYAGAFTYLYTTPNETLPFNATAWSHDGMLCAFGGNQGTGSLRLCFAPENGLYYLATNTYLIQSPTALSLGTPILSMQFSNTSNNYIVTGNGASVSVYYLGQLSNYNTTLSLNKTNLTLNSDLQLNTTVTFNGNCTINGNSNKLVLGSGAYLTVATGSTLSLQDIEIVGLNKSNLQCIDNTGSIMVENSTLTLTSNFVFGSGSMLFNMGVKISGTNKFSYTSKMTSTINSESILYLDKNLTFSYAPTGAYRNLIYMPDSSAYMILDGCTLHSSRTGLQLTTGQLFINNNVTLQSEGVVSSQSIAFGNNNAKKNLTINVLSDAQLNIYGRLEYQNTN